MYASASVSVHRPSSVRTGRRPSGPPRPPRRRPAPPSRPPPRPRRRSPCPAPGPTARPGRRPAARGLPLIDAIIVCIRPASRPPACTRSARTSSPSPGSRPSSCTGRRTGTRRSRRSARTCPCTPRRTAATVGWSMTIADTSSAFTSPTWNVLDLHLPHHAEQRDERLVLGLLDSPASLATSG